jgi:heme-degrading monooxygenase HmoA
MVVEHALLRVHPGSEAAFEAAMREARPLISASAGFVSIAVRPAVETAGVYLLLVEWESIADHRDGFRQSDRYQSWRGLLHHFYDPMPGIDYFGDPL